MKRWMTVCAAVAAIALIAAPAFAGGKSGQAGNSNTAHLYLYAKDCGAPVDPDVDPWSIVDDGWGKMKYNLSGSTLDFVMNGHGLEPGIDYTLIYYPDPWPGTGLICLGDDVANGGGNVHIAGSVDTGDLPIEGDGNDPGAKIWLALSADVDCGSETDPGQMIGWTCSPGGPSEYLFESELIVFDDIDE